MIDVIAHDTKAGEVVLVMTEAHPELVGKPARIEVRCAHMPDPRALEVLGMIHDQLAFQDIKMEVVVKDR